MRKWLNVVRWLSVALILSTGALAGPYGKLSAETPVTIQLDDKGSIDGQITALLGAGHSSQLSFLLRRVIERFVISLSAREALAAMDAGLLTSSQYVDILLERIDAHSELNAFIHIDPETARAAAEKADALRTEGEIVGPLHGLPLLLKDNINTVDMPTTAGTPALDGHQPTKNAAVVQILIDAGAIILGKTNLHELAASITSNNAFTGPVRNPYDLERIAGGSSGGNAAALAAWFAPLAIGTDVIGSGRIPAALTGTMGFRPSTGRYPTAGIVSLSATMETVAPMGRHVLDLALIDSIFTGAPMDLDHISLRGVRIGVPMAYFRDNLDGAVRRAVNRALRRLEWAGATLVEEDIIGVPELSWRTSQILTFFEAVRDFGIYLEEQNTGLTVMDVGSMIASPDVVLLFKTAISGGISQALYEQFLFGVRPMLQDIYQRYLDDHELDIILYPTTPLPAAPIGQDQTVELNGEQVSTFDTYTRMTHFTPVIGAPTLTLPIGQNRERLPMGIDIAGAPGADRQVLAIGHAISQILPRVRPPKNIRPQPLLLRSRIEQRHVQK